MVLEICGGSPSGTSGKEPASQCRRQKRHGFEPSAGKITLEEGMATHSSILAWRIPWTEEPGGLQSVGRKESDTTERLSALRGNGRKRNTNCENGMPRDIPRSAWSVKNRSLRASGSQGLGTETRKRKLREGGALALTTAAGTWELEPLWLLEGPGA